MTTPFIRHSNGINYIRFNNGMAYVYAGASGIIGPPIFEYTVCQTGSITSDYAITFIDEAHPLYVIGSGEIGSMWGPDVYYYHENIDPNFPSCAHILFDVDTPFVARGKYQGQIITEDPFYVYPTGVNHSSPAGCELPMPELNIVEIARPSGGLEYDGVTEAVGSISQNTFKDNIITGIETVWGSGFWNKMAAASGTHKLWIIRENGLSMGSGVIQPGIDLFKNYLTSQNIDFTEHFPSCAENDRYLGWLTDCITYQGENVSCTGLFPIVDITEGDIQGSGTHNPTNKLVIASFEGYSSGNGVFLEDNTKYINIAPVFDDNTIFYPGIWSNLVVSTYVIDYAEYVIDPVYQQGVMTYSYTGRFYYLNGLPKMDLYTVCYTPSGNVYYTWQASVPVDEYGVPGVPNGKVQPERLISVSVSDDMDQYDYEIDSYCVPRFPNISFTSYIPPSFTSAPGANCTAYNP